MDLQKLMQDYKIKYTEKCQDYCEAVPSDDEMIIEKIKEWKMFEDGLIRSMVDKNSKSIVKNSGEEFFDPDIERDKDYDIDLKINVEKSAQEFLSKIS